jgi:hypothetical protein
MSLSDGRDLGKRLHGWPTVRGHAHDLSEASSDATAEEWGISVVEQPPIRGGEPVAQAVGHRCHIHDWLAQ